VALLSEARMAPTGCAVFGRFTSDFNNLWLFSDFLDSEKSNRKTKFFQVLDFDAKKF
jgi:hypothetical protein